MSIHLCSIDDISDKQVDAILARAREFKQGTRPKATLGSPSHVLGLVFMEASLRTRVGFSAAALNLGFQPISVVEQRANPRSMAESVEDTVRVAADMSSVVVVRLTQPVTTVTPGLTTPLINGGDVGEQAEHPTQALIDLFVMEDLVGPIDGLHVSVCGDLRLRTSRSLLGLLKRRRPRRLTLVSLPELGYGSGEGESLTLPSLVNEDLRSVDVLYVAGIPHQATDEAGRAALRVTPDVISRLPARSVVLSPGPVIDEIDFEARKDARVRVFDQSRLGLYVRMAILESVAFRGAVSRRV